MADETIQERFIQQIKDRLPPDKVLVDVLADMLNVSTDSAYRRIRGETHLAIDEVQELSDKFGISVDSLFGASSDVISFNYRALSTEDYDLKQYLNSIKKDMQQIASFEEATIWYAGKDIPLFHLFQIPEIAAFKMFVWSKTIAGLESLEGVKFDPNKLESEFIDIGKDILDLQMRIPTIEIWNEETITSALQQIEYYHLSGYFQNKGDAKLMVQKIRDLMDHISIQAEHGYKYHIGRKPMGEKDNFKMYWNEIVLPENTILVNLGDVQMTYLSHNVMNLLETASPRFCKLTENTLSNMMKRSILISSVSERDRGVFFRKMTEKIDRLEEKL